MAKALTFGGSTAPTLRDQVPELTDHQARMFEGYAMAILMLKRRQIITGKTATYAREQLARLIQREVEQERHGSFSSLFMALPNRRARHARSCRRARAFRS